MSKFIQTLSFLVISGSLATGCIPTTKDASGDTGSSANGGGGGGGGGGSGDATTIYDVQMNSFDEGTVVTISNAIVTSPIIPGDYPGFFVQSAEGGEYNGLYIFMYDEVAEVYQPSVGDIVQITGEYAEFYENSQLKVTVPGNISVTGTGGEIVVTELTEEPDIWEPYESVVVKFTDAEIIDASKLYEWGAVQLAIGCWMDNVFTNYEAEDGAKYESITGPITYSFEKFSILPRTEADLVGYSGGSGGGSGGTEICDDDTDNDGDGYVDCDDWDCDDDPACGGSSGGGEGDEICDDDTDNDGDGYIDCDDWDCDDDPACGSSGGGEDEVCDDGEDNDGDSYIDCVDFDCTYDAACAEDCTDGVDNDGDGYLDCDDWYCTEDPACAE